MKLAKRQSRIGLRFVSLLFVSWLLAHSCLAVAQRAKDYEVMAGYLYHFLNFVEWPTTTPKERQVAFVVCVMGDDPFHGKLDEITQRTVKNRMIELRYLDVKEPAIDCHQLFISRDLEPRLDMLLQSLQGTDVLTISDIDQFAHRGGILEFTLIDNRIGLTVNIAQLKRTQIQISSNLLELAELVGKEEQP